MACPNLLSLMMDTYCIPLCKHVDRFPIRLVEYGCTSVTSYQSAQSPGFQSLRHFHLILGHPADLYRSWLASSYDQLGHLKSISVHWPENGRNRFWELRDPRRPAMVIETSPEAPGETSSWVVQKLRDANPKKRYLLDERELRTQQTEYWDGRN